MLANCLMVSTGNGNISRRFGGIRMVAFEGIMEVAKSTTSTDSPDFPLSYNGAN